MNKNEKEARDWLLSEENLGTDNYDLDQADRRLVTEIEYESGEDVSEYSLEEEKLEINGEEYTALRAYGNKGLDAAEVYPGDGMGRKPSREFEDMNFTAPDFPGSSALSVLNNIGNDEEEKSEVEEEREKAVAGAAEDHDLAFDLDEL